MLIYSNENCKNSAYDKFFVFITKKILDRKTSKVRVYF